MPSPLNGIHHVSSLTRDAVASHRFYTQVLGLRLVKKSVNQDDPGTYHLFYADGIGSPGTDTTFFDFPRAARVPRGNNSVSKTTFRVRDEEDLSYWTDRLSSFGTETRGTYNRNGALALDFVDPDGTALSLLGDSGSADGHPWASSPVPEKHQLLGLGYPILTVPDLRPTHQFLTEVLGMILIDEYPEPGSGHFRVCVYESVPGRLDAQIHVLIRDDLPRERIGAGGVHHVALRVSDETEFGEWPAYLGESGHSNSGIVDRYWFRSIYVREPNGILFELATDGPGFSIDENPGSLGERLALPPHLEARRDEIEARLRPLTLTTQAGR
jgi:glyoxalase family protein